MSECERDVVKTGKLHSQSMQSEMDSRLLILSYSSGAFTSHESPTKHSISCCQTSTNIYTPLGFMSIILVLMDTQEERST